MKLNRIIIILCVLVLNFYLPLRAFAADVLHRLTHGDQHALVLGTVVSDNETVTGFQVETIISGKTVPGSIEVKTSEALTLTPNMELEAGDYVVISLDRDKEKYVIAWGIFKVSSLDISTLEVIDGPLATDELKAFQWYVNSGGVENDFSFVGSTAYVRHSNGDSEQIYPVVESGSQLSGNGAGLSGESEQDELVKQQIDNALLIYEKQYQYLCQLLPYVFAGCQR